MLVALNEMVFTDLAVGVSHEDFAGTDDGGVNVIYGSSGGLTATGNQFWSQNSAGISGAAESGDQFGFSLASADFDGDGFSDLAAGVNGENFATSGRDGGVNIIYGSSAGLSATGNQFWSQDSAGILGTAEVSDFFGSSLAAANFGKSSHADLAVGVVGEDLGATDDGGVHVIYGSSGGLTATGNQFWGQDEAGIFGTAETGDRFGSSLAAANLGKSSEADLAVDVPEEDLGAFDEGFFNEGGVNVIYGSSGGLTATGDQFWTQNSSGILETSERG